MAITLATFRTRFPELTSISDPVIELYLDDAELLLNEDYWGTKYELGVYYLAAHYTSRGVTAAGTTPGSLPSSGTPSSRTVDGVSVVYNNTFASPAGGKDRLAEYGLTIYGQRLTQLIRTLGVPAFVV